MPETPDDLDTGLDTASAGETRLDAAYFSDLADEPEEDYLPPPAQGFRMRGLTAALALLATLAGGFLIGAVVEKHHPTAATSALGRRGLGSGAAGAFGSGGATTGAGSFAGLATGGAFGGSGAGAGSATSGIVTGVKDGVLYVTDSSGALVKVTLGPSAAVNRVSSASLSDLQTGDNVVVRGTTASNGTVTATSITDSPATPTSTTP
ncbi:MAG: hypothetical protein ACRDY0_07960 [Acidimicrobiales bacterium]